MVLTINTSKVAFDVTNEQHAAMYRKFVMSGNWQHTPDGTCPFQPEGSYVSIPAMLADKYVKYVVSQIEKGELK